MWFLYTWKGLNVLKSGRPVQVGKYNTDHTTSHVPRSRAPVITCLGHVMTQQGHFRDMAVTCSILSRLTCFALHTSPQVPVPLVLPLRVSRGLGPSGVHHGVQRRLRWPAGIRAWWKSFPFELVPVGLLSVACCSSRPQSVCLSLLSGNCHSHRGVSGAAGSPGCGQKHYVAPAINLMLWEWQGGGIVLRGGGGYFRLGVDLEPRPLWHCGEGEWGNGNGKGGGGGGGLERGPTHQSVLVQVPNPVLRVGVWGVNSHNSVMGMYSPEQYFEAFCLK